MRSAARWAARPIARPSKLNTQRLARPRRPRDAPSAIARYRAAMKQTVEAEPGIDVRQAHVAAARRGRARHGVEGQDGHYRAPRRDRDGRHLPARADPWGSIARAPGAPASSRRSTCRMRCAISGSPRASEDRHLAAAASRLHRLGAARGRVGRRAPVAVSLGHHAAAAAPRWPVCVTWTTPATHAVIRENLDRSPLYSGVIDATGVRCCPSIEDKVVRFVERERHQVVLEPDGLDTEEIYANGISTSLPLDVQARLVHTIPGLERAEIMRPATPSSTTSSTRRSCCRRSNCATCRRSGWREMGGATGYEEAAALGLWAGINAACVVRDAEPSCPIARMLHGRARRRSRDPWHRRAVPDVHVARGVPAPLAGGQRRHAAGRSRPAARARRRGAVRRRGRRRRAGCETALARLSITRGRRVAASAAAPTGGYATTSPAAIRSR